MSESVIVCVDDEEMVLRSLQRELNDALENAYLIETAEGGHDALTLLQELQDDGYDVPLLICDHIMPDMKGDELLRRIHQQFPATLKIMLTGQADMQAVTNALNSADLYRYIAKPWEPTDLIMTVKEALRRYDQEQQLAEQNRLLRDLNQGLEEQVRDRTAELEVQKAELEQKNRQLRDVNASKDTFFSIIAHDLKNPFTSLLGYTDLILEQFDHYQPEELRADVEHLQASAKQVYALLKNLLAWARIQRGTMAYRPTTIDLAELIQTTIFMFAATAKQKSVKLKSDVHSPCLARGDYHMIDTVIRNLVSNALKFTPSGGRVMITAQAASDSVQVAVSDTGVGIPDTALADLFRIDRHHSTPGTHGEEGTGLGLILCRELIDKNQGTLRVESTVGTGTTFSVTLPSASTRSQQ